MSLSCRGRSTTHARREREAQHAAEFAGGPVDGLIIVLAVDIRSYVDRLHRQGVPFVLLDHDSNVPDTTFITAAYRDALRDAGIEHDARLVVKGDFLEASLLTPSLTTVRQPPQ